MLETVFIRFLEISATTSIIILVLRLLAPYLNKTYAAKWKYWIWLILAVWLIIPARISLPTTPVEVNIPNAPIITSDNVLPNAPSSGVTVQPDATTIQPEQILPLTETQRPITLLDVIALIWLIGIVAFLVYQMAGYFIFKKKVLRWSRAPQDPRIERAIHLASSKIGLSKRVVPLISNIVSSPLMIGFFRPLLILPCETYSDVDLSFIVRHELAHCKRNDLWYKLLLIITNAVHWYNPVVYLMFHEASGDLELSCDDVVTNGMSFAERKVYTETILASIQRKRMKKTALSTYFYGGQRIMKNRFINILNTEKKRRGAFAFLALLLCTALVGGLIACTADIENNSEEYDTYTVEGITVSVLKEYADLVVVDTEGNDEWMHEVIALYYKPAYDEHADFGWMFSIMRCDYAQMLTLIGEASDGVSFKATDGDNYYFYYEPTDVQWSSPEEYEEYTNICDSINVSYGELEEFSNSDMETTNAEPNGIPDAMLDTALSEAEKVEAIGDIEIKGLISKDTAYLSQTTEPNYCEVIFPVDGYDYYIGVSFTRENENSGWTLSSVNAVNVYDPDRWTNIHIALATDELLGEYDSFYEYVNNEDGDRLIIWTDTVIEDFAFVTIDYETTGDKISLIAGDVLYSVDDLSPEKPFVVTLLDNGGVIPTYGISFVDENGVMRLFSINLSGRDAEEAPPYYLVDESGE